MRDGTVRDILDSEAWQAVRKRAVLVPLFAMILLGLVSNFWMDKLIWAVLGAMIYAAHSMVMCIRKEETSKHPRRRRVSVAELVLLLAVSAGLLALVVVVALRAACMPAPLAQALVALAAVFAFFAFVFWALLIAVMCMNDVAYIIIFR